MSARFSFDSIYIFEYDFPCLYTLFDEVVFDINMFCSAMAFVIHSVCYRSTVICMNQNR